MATYWACRPSCCRRRAVPFRRTPSPTCSAIYAAVVPLIPPLGILKEPEAVSSKAAVQKRFRSREIVTAIVFVRVCAELFADALYRPTAFGQTNGCRSCRWTRALSFSRSPRTSADPGVGIAKLRKRKAGCDSQIENAEKCVTKFESCGGFELPGRKCSARRKPRIIARFYLERWVAPKSAALSG